MVNILVVEEDRSVTRILKETLEAEGYQVTNGAQWQRCCTICAP